MVTSVSRRCGDGHSDRQRALSSLGHPRIGRAATTQQQTRRRRQPDRGTTRWICNRGAVFTFPVPEAIERPPTASHTDRPGEVPPATPPAARLVHELRIAANGPRSRGEVDGAKGPRSPRGCLPRGSPATRRREAEGGFGHAPRADSVNPSGALRGLQLIPLRELNNAPDAPLIGEVRKDQGSPQTPGPRSCGAPVDWPRGRT
jgi:hypothetical protein